MSGKKNPKAPDLKKISKPNLTINGNVVSKNEILKKRSSPSEMSISSSLSFESDNESNIMILDNSSKKSSSKKLPATRDINSAYKSKSNRINHVLSPPCEFAIPPSEIPKIPPLGVKPIGSKKMNNKIAIEMIKGNKVNEKPNYSIMSLVEQQKFHKILNARFLLLSNGYPNLEIPEIDDNYSLDEKHDIYVHIVNKILAQNSLSTYRIFTIIGFFGVELFCINVLKIEYAKGFASIQIEQMKLYDELLIQLGEKMGVNSMSSWPIEIRIIFTVVSQLILFILLKAITSHLGFELPIKKIYSSLNENLLVKNKLKIDENGLPEVGNNPFNFNINNISSFLGNLFGNNDENSSNSPPKRKNKETINMNW